MAVFTDPFDALTNFQEALDTYRTSSWLDAGLSGGGAFPPLNVFRKGDDFIIIAELPGVKKSNLDVQVKGRTVRLAGEGTVGYPEKAALHRRERRAGLGSSPSLQPLESGSASRTANVKAARASLRRTRRLGAGQGALAGGPCFQRGRRNVKQRIANLIVGSFLAFTLFGAAMAGSSSDILSFRSFWRCEPCPHGDKRMLHCGHH